MSRRAPRRKLPARHMLRAGLGKAPTRERVHSLPALWRAASWRADRKRDASEANVTEGRDDAFYEGCCCQAPLRISLSAGTVRAACYLRFGRSCPDPPSIRADHVGPVTTFRYSPVGELQQAWREAPHLRSGRRKRPGINRRAPPTQIPYSAPLPPYLAKPLLSLGSVSLQQCTFGHGSVLEKAP